MYEIQNLNWEFLLFQRANLKNIDHTYLQTSHGKPYAFFNQPDIEGKKFPNLMLILLDIYLLIYYWFLVLRFDNLDERTVMPSAGAISDEKRNLYSPEIFLYDIAFDPNLHNLNSPSYTPDESTGKPH